MVGLVTYGSGILPCEYVLNQKIDLSRSLVKILFRPNIVSKEFLQFLCCIGNFTPMHSVLENDKQTKLWQTYFVLSFKSNNHEMELNSTEYMIL